MRFEEKQVYADLVVVGAGMPGMCAAIQAAREGLDVVLINDRGCVGGNCSQEIFVTCAGAPDCSPLNINSREGGIVEAIREETVYRTPERNRFIQDTVFMDALLNEKEHLKLYLNTCIDSAELDENGRIKSVSGTQNTTETRYTFIAPFFVDDTGDGTLAAMAGADFMIGREAKSTFNEKVAPDEADSFVIPSTLTFFSKDTGKPVEFVPPAFAFDIAASGALKYRKIPHNNFNFQWFYEGDGAKDQVKDREEIIQYHRSLVYGIWNHIKNSGEYPESKNYDLEFVGLIPGMREYRRVCGDVILTENDLVNQNEFEDTVAHGGWNIDLHAIRGFFDDDLINRHINFRGIYSIPYRCSYSRNVENLFMCGRCMSTSHVAFGSTRVAATLSTLGQAVGMAAAICKEKQTTPRGVYEKYTRELQQRLLREDQLIPGLKNEDPRDLALSAQVEVSSEAMLELTKQDGEIEIGDGLMLALPFTNAARQLILTCRSDADTQLEYIIFKPFRGYNFGPDEEVASGSIPVSGNGSMQDVIIPVDMLSPGSYYMIALKENEHIAFARAEEALPTTILYNRYRNKQETIWNYYTMSMAEYFYSRHEDCICYRFDTPQRAYKPENVVNGYNRAYFGTNMWFSAEGDEKPCLTLKFNEPKEVSQVQITFGINNTTKIYFYTKRLFKHLSRKYKVYGLLNGKETLLVDVKENHLKFNRHQFTPGVYDSLRFEFEENHGGQVAIQEIRAEA